MKKRNLIFVVLIITIIAIAAGFLIGRATVNNIDKNAVIVPSTDVSTSLEENNITENDYPFELYSSFLENSSSDIINNLNNNPIDKKYYKKYINAKSLAEEQDILSDWDKAYEKEFENAKSKFEELVKEYSDDEHIITSDELINSMRSYVNECHDYTDSTAKLAYDFEEFWLGHGTNHVYDLLLNSLELNRRNTLRLIECVYFLDPDNDYNWSVHD